MAETKDVITKPEKKKEKVEDVKPKNLHKSGEGLNLIAPRLEKIKEETAKKFKIDIRIVLFVLFVVLGSLGVVGYNWVTGIRLDNAKIEMENLEEELMSYKYTIEANNQVLERYDLYQNIQGGFISSKEVFTFWDEVSHTLAGIGKIQLSQGVNFEVSGEADNLRDVAKMWHFLSIDQRVLKVSLEGLSIPRRDREEQKLAFSFKGTLNLENFNKSEDNLEEGNVETNGE